MQNKAMAQQLFEHVQMLSFLHALQLVDLCSFMLR